MKSDEETDKNELSEGNRSQEEEKAEERKSKEGSTSEKEFEVVEQEKETPGESGDSVEVTKEPELDDEQSKEKEISKEKQTMEDEDEIVETSEQDRVQTLTNNIDLPPKSSREVLEDPDMNPLAPSKNEARFLTYNVFMRPVVGYNTDKKDKRMILIKQYLHRFQIVCFQEIFPNLNYRRADLLKYAEACQFKHASIPPKPGILTTMKKGHVLNAGLLTFSKYPISKTEFVAFKSKSGVDGLALKGVLYSKIIMPNHYSIHVFNTHTQATYKCEYQPNNPSDHKNFVARLKQIVELRKAVETLLGKYSRLEKDGPENFKDLVLIAGDFNINSRGKPLPRENFNKLEWVKNLPADQKEFLEYDYLVGVLSNNQQDELKDLAFESYGEHPITFGDVTPHENPAERKPREIYLTNPEEYMSQQSLDYIFHFVPKGVPKTEMFSLDSKDCRINEFFHREKDISQLSDHYGVECRLDIAQGE